MEICKLIDINFDFRSDTPPGKDPDALSPTLRKYHKLLWSKPLPSGVVFELDDTTPRVYLHHRSEVGRFFLTSDGAITLFHSWKSIRHIINQLPEAEQKLFNRYCYTIGGMMVFPGNRINGKRTINGARGCHPQIKDRFDLTLECIRRHYLNEPSPLSDTLAMYSTFFALFKDFRGYVEFFLLQDIVSEDYSCVRFFSPFHDFKTGAVPNSVDAYKQYRRIVVDFIKARSHRMLKGLA